MGWSRGVNNEGREVGYAVAATCDRDDCDAKIDRGLGYCCGNEHGEGGEWGCGRYFCGEHLTFTWWTPPEGFSGQLCHACADRLEAELQPDEDGNPTRELGAA